MERYEGIPVSPNTENRTEHEILSITDYQFLLQISLSLVNQRISRKIHLGKVTNSTTQLVGFKAESTFPRLFGVAKQGVK